LFRTTRQNVCIEARLTINVAHKTGGGKRMDVNASSQVLLPCVPHHRPCSFEFLFVFGRLAQELDETANVIRVGINRPLRIVPQLHIIGHTSSQIGSEALPVRLTISRSSSSSSQDFLAHRRFRNWRNNPMTEPITKGIETIGGTRNLINP